jgi:hypothetical protein
MFFPPLQNIVTGLCVWGCAVNLLPLQIPSENWTNCANACAYFVILLYKFTMNVIKCKVSNLSKNAETEEMYPFYEQMFRIDRKARTETVRAKAVFRTWDQRSQWTDQ